MSEPVHGAIRLIAENCTSCYICARECPAWCISIDAHAEPVAAQPGAPAARRQRAKAVLDRFAIDFADCMYCGICVEECPFDALAWVAEPVRPAPGRAGLLLEMEDLTALGADEPAS